MDRLKPTEHRSHPFEEDCVIGMDVPIPGSWEKEDFAFWTGSERYQPWKDVAAFFRNTESAP